MTSKFLIAAFSATLMLGVAQVPGVSQVAMAADKPAAPKISPKVLKPLLAAQANAHWLGMTVRAAGGAVLTPAGEPLTYGKATDFYRNGPFIAWGDTRQT